MINIFISLIIVCIFLVKLDEKKSWEQNNK